MLICLGKLRWISPGNFAIVMGCAGKSRLTATNARIRIFLHLQTRFREDSAATHRASVLRRVKVGITSVRTNTGQVPAPCLQRRIEDAESTRFDPWTCPQRDKRLGVRTRGSGRGRGHCRRHDRRRPWPGSVLNLLVILDPHQGARPLLFGMLNERGGRECENYLRL